MRSAFGWSLPPGVTNRMIEEAYGEDGPCQCCGRDPADCVCPECQVCGEQGNPKCYEHSHGGELTLKFNKAQRMGQSRMRVDGLQLQIGDEQQYQAWLEQQPDDWVDK